MGEVRVKQVPRPAFAAEPMHGVERALDRPRPLAPAGACRLPEVRRRRAEPQARAIRARLPRRPLGRNSTTSTWRLELWGIVLRVTVSPILRPRLIRS